MKEMLIEELSKRFSELYGEHSAQFSSFTSEQKNLIQSCCAFLNAGFHPVSVFNDEAIAKIREITNVNFHNFTVPDAKTAHDTVIDVNGNDFKFDPTVAPKTAVCSFFSQHNNLSETYEYANITDVPNCSNKKVDGMYCFANSMQSQCPYYTPDYSLIATHAISEAGKDHIYSAYKYRNIESQIVILIYNDSNTLMHELTYPIQVIKELPIGALEEEITSIVKEVHNSSFIETTSNMDIIYPSSLVDSISSKNSYISTLIS